MLLLGALFALLGVGFWLYCLVDVALTPGNECRGLPKAAWIAIVAGTFAIGAAVWLGFRGPARPTLSPARRLRPGVSGRDVDGPPHVPGRHDPSVPRNVRPRPRARNDPDHTGGDPPSGAEPGGWPGPGQRGRPAADAPQAPHPASLPHPRTAPGRPAVQGPDDDPEFLSSLNRAIHGTEPGGEPEGPAGPACWPDGPA